MHNTAVGKCLLAYMQEPQRSNIINGILEQQTYNTITNPVKLKQELDLVMSRGYAKDNEELEIGLSCIAVPILRDNNSAICGVSISGATNRINSLDIAELISYMKNVAIKISSIIFTKGS